MSHYSRVCSKLVTCASTHARSFYLNSAVERAGDQPNQPASPYAGTCPETSTNRRHRIKKTKAHLTSRVPSPPCLSSDEWPRNLSNRDCMAKPLVGMNLIWALGNADNFAHSVD